jgi:hypothetical protein
MRTGDFGTCPSPTCRPTVKSPFGAGEWEGRNLDEGQRSAGRGVSEGQMRVVDSPFPSPGDDEVVRGWSGCSAFVAMMEPANCRRGSRCALPSLRGRGPPQGERPEQIHLCHPPARRTRPAPSGSRPLGDELEEKARNPRGRAEPKPSPTAGDAFRRWMVEVPSTAVHGDHSR